MKRPWILLVVGLVIAVTGFFLIVIEIYSSVGWILLAIGLFLLLLCWPHPSSSSPRSQPWKENKSWPPDPERKENKSWPPDPDWWY